MEREIYQRKSSLQINIRLSKGLKFTSNMIYINFRLTFPSSSSISKIPSSFKSLVNSPPIHITCSCGIHTLAP